MLRVMTYNVHRWEDDHDALATVLRACSPDLVMLQEAPSGLGAWRRRTELALSGGLRLLAGARRTAALAADPGRWQPRTRWVVRPVVRRYHRVVIPQLPNGAVAATTDLDGVLVTVIGCHLGLHNQGRLDELRQVLHLTPQDHPYVVVGDINEPAGGPVWELAAADGLIDQGAAEPRPTFPADRPQNRIDAIWTSPAGDRSGGLDVRLIDPASLGIESDLLARASDHLPVIAEIRRG